MKTSKKQLFFFNALIFVIALILLQYAVVSYDQEKKTIVNENFEPNLQGRFQDIVIPFDEPQPMPKIEFNTMFDKRINIDDLRGQWIVLNLWATWCAPCLVEMPSLQAAQDFYGGQGIKIVAVSVDRNMDAAKLKDFIKRENFGPIAAHYDPNNIIMGSLNIRGLPTSYILAPNGMAVAKIEGMVKKLDFS
jgi:thiol-disulfide isomerase/thioredoxin